jgi:hypothetical protein
MARYVSLGDLVSVFSSSSFYVDWVEIGDDSGVYACVVGVIAFVRMVWFYMVGFIVTSASLWYSGEC